MVREELFSLCEEYVRLREAEAAALASSQSLDDPAPEILRSFRLAEISESEMEALLAYVGDPDEEDCCHTAGIADDQYDTLSDGLPKNHDASTSHTRPQ